MSARKAKRQPRRKPKVRHAGYRLSRNDVETVRLSLLGWDVCPKVPLIDDTIGVMSVGEKRFLAALVRVYNAEDGGRLLERVGVWSQSPTAG